MLNLVKDKKLFILDVDGVILKGEKPIGGAAEAIEKLRSEGKKIVFLSNNSTRSRRIYIRKLRKAGIKVSKEELMLATTATASFIAREKEGARVLTTGEDGLKEELRLAGLKIVDNPEKAEYFVAASNRKINFDIFTKALRTCLRDEVRYIAVNPDKLVPAEDGVVPGTGLVIGALYWLTGRKPDVIVGKPSPIIVKEVLKKEGIKRKDAVIVGDLPGTDIKVANRMGITSVLVLSGAVTRENWRKKVKEEKVKPDIVVNSISELVL